MTPMGDSKCKAPPRAGLKTGGVRSPALEVLLLSLLSGLLCCPPRPALAVGVGGFRPL